jgi:hypothetical protein
MESEENFNFDANFVAFIFHIKVNLLTSLYGLLNTHI